MKLILTVDTFKSGDKNGVAWASASGIDAVGRRARAAFRDPREGDGRKRASAMIDQMARTIPEGQDVADIRPIVECMGSWRDRPISREGKPVMRAGEPVKERYFEVVSFNILSGPALELRRTKQRASEVVDAVQAALQAGDAHKAAETAMDFLRLFSGRPADDLDDVDADEPDAPNASNGVVDAAPVSAEIATVATEVSAPIVDADTAAAPIADAPVVEAVAAAPAVEPTVAEATVVEAVAEDVVVASDVPQPSSATEASAPEAGIASEPAVEAPEAPVAATPNDFESLVSALEAAPPLVAEADAGKPIEADVPVAAPSRPDLGARPPAPASAARPALPPRPAMGGLQRPGGVVAARPAVGAVAQPAQPPQRVGGAPATVSRAAAPAPMAGRMASTQPAPARVGPGPGGLRPVAAPRLAPSAAVAPPVGAGYRTTEPGEDPEALAAVHLAKAARPGMPQSLRPAPTRPGVR